MRYWMADFCMQCSIELFGEDCGDLANLYPDEELLPGYGWAVLCEGCGPAIVDYDGRCIAKHCLKKHGEKNDAT